jgi:hypothetical protein
VPTTPTGQPSSTPTMQPTSQPSALTENEALVDDFSGNIIDAAKSGSIALIVSLDEVICHYYCACIFTDLI